MVDTNWIGHLCSSTCFSDKYHTSFGTVMLAVEVPCYLQRLTDIVLFCWSKETPLVNKTTYSLVLGIQNMTAQKIVWPVAWYIAAQGAFRVIPFYRRQWNLFETKCELFEGSVKAAITSNTASWLILCSHYHMCLSWNFHTSCASGCLVSTMQATWCTRFYVSQTKMKAILYSLNGECVNLAFYVCLNNSIFFGSVMLFF